MAIGGDRRPERRAYRQTNGRERRDENDGQHGGPRNLQVPEEDEHLPLSILPTPRANLAPQDAASLHQNLNLLNMANVRLRDRNTYHVAVNQDLLQQRYYLFCVTIGLLIILGLSLLNSIQLVIILVLCFAVSPAYFFPRRNY